MKSTASSSTKLGLRLSSAAPLKTTSKNTTDQQFVYGLNVKSAKRKLGNCRRTSNTESPKIWKNLRTTTWSVKRLALDEKARSINLTDNGSVKMEERLGDMQNLENTSLFDYENIGPSITSTRPQSYYLFRRDVDYVVQDNQVVIVDEFTGRLMPGRRFSDELHRLWKPKRHHRRENQTLATITFRYFRLYSSFRDDGTAETERKKFKKSTILVS